MKLKIKLMVLLLVSFLGFFLFTPPMVQQIPKNKTWDFRSDGLEGSGANCMVHHPDNNGVMIVGSKVKGLFISTNYTKKWRNILLDKFDRTWINCISVHPRQSNKLMVGSLSGLFISDDMGSTWYERKFGTSVLQVFSIAFHPKEDNTILIGTYEGGIIKSNDSGESWNYLYKGNPNLETRVTSIQINPKNPLDLVASLYGKGILKSVNGGESWEEMNTGLYDLNILTMKMDPEDPLILYSGTLGGLFKTTNGGKDWFPCNKGITSVWKEIYSIVISPKHSSELYIGSNRGGVFFSKDKGDNWEQLPQIIRIGSKKDEELWVYDLVLDPLHPSMLYAGTSAGVFRFRNTNEAFTNSMKLVIESPKHNDTILDSSFLLKGTAVDTEFGLDRVTVNQKTVLVDSYGNFEQRIPLRFGKNSIHIAAINNDDFGVAKTLEIFGIVDSTPPDLVVYYPENNPEQRVYTESLLITGKAEDFESGIENVLINGVVVPVSGKGEFNKTIMLDRGKNRIVIEAKNCAGKNTIVVRSIFFDFPRS
jgi:photosystem II stability/assembly factor-like uncharacterized protein